MQGQGCGLAKRLPLLEAQNIPTPTTDKDVLTFACRSETPRFNGKDANKRLGGCSFSGARLSMASVQRLTRTHWWAPAPGSQCSCYLCLEFNLSTALSILQEQHRFDERPAVWMFQTKITSTSGLSPITLCLRSHRMEQFPRPYLLDATFTDYSILQYDASHA